MISVLASVFWFVLLLLLVDCYSTFVALVLCTTLIYSFVKIFPHVLEKRITALVITRICIVLSLCYRVSRAAYCLVKTLLTSKVKPNHSRSHFQSRLCSEPSDLEKEVDVLVRNISRHYIHPWYDSVSNKDEFINYLNSTIKEAILALCNGLTKLEKKKLSLVAFHIYLHYFIHFTEAKEKAGVFDYENFEMKHWAVNDDLTQWCYLQSLVSALIDTFGPVDVERSLHSHQSPVLHSVVVEILTQNVVFPLINLICNPSRLNQLILKLLLYYIHSDPQLKAMLELKFSNHTIMKPIIVLPNEKLREYNFKSDEAPKKTQTQLPFTANSNSFYTSKTSESKSFSIGSPSDGLSRCISSTVKSSSNTNLLENTFHEQQNAHYISCDTAMIKRSRSADFIRSLSQLRALNGKDYNFLQGTNNRTRVAMKSEAYNPVEQAQEAIDFEIPALFTDVQIIDTTLQYENGPYTLYTIQYSAVFHDTSQPSDAHHFVKQVIYVKRRFREFLHLHSKLEENSTLKYYLKGIKGPSKWQILPFQNLDKKNIAERRLFLEEYLSELCSNSVISQSTELQEFLAYGGESKVQLSKRSLDISPLRLDKMFVRGVKGAIDIFKTAASTIDGENIAPFSKTLDDSISPLKFQEHLVDYLNSAPKIKKHILKYFKKSDDSSSMCSERNIEDTFSENKFLRHISSPSCACCELEDSYPPDMDLFGNVISDLLVVALKLDSVESTKLVSVLKLLCSSYIERYISGVIEYISDDYIKHAIHLIHVLLWPDENQNVQTKENTSSSVNNVNALECLEVILSSYWFIETFGVFKGHLIEKSKLFNSSFQNDAGNRCLLFHILDAVVEKLCYK